MTVFFSGKSTIIGLAKRGAKVYMGSRSKAKAAEAIHEIKVLHADAQVHFLHIDLSSLGNVIAAAQEIKESVSPACFVGSSVALADYLCNHCSEKKPNSMA